MPRPMSDDLRFHKASGQWVKQVRRKTFYFGTDEEAAKAKWKDDKPFIVAGKAPPKQSGEPTVVELANRYNKHQEHQLESGEAGIRHVGQCRKTLKRFIEIVGGDCRLSQLSPLDWADVKAKLFSPVKRTQPIRGGVFGRQVKRRSNETVASDVRRIRTFVQWSVDCELIPAPRWSKMFAPATRSSAVVNPQAKPFKGFEPKQLRAIIEAASVHFKPIVLLALNGGVGNFDISEMTMAHVESIKSKSVREHWCDLPRIKTGNERRFVLWPETVEAIRNYLVLRRRPLSNNDTKRLFITQTGRPWIEIDSEGESKDSIGMTFRKLRIEAGLTSGSFYDCRRQFQTIGSETLDFPAVKFVMGHAKRQKDMSERYSLKISDERIANVCSHVRQWLYGEVAQ